MSRTSQNMSIKMLQYYITGALFICLAVGCTTGLGQILSGTPDANGGSSQQDNDGKSKYEHPGMLNPAQGNLKAPAKFKVKIETTKGNLVLECNREWSPNGADRFYSLVKIGYLKDIVIFRAINDFMFQFGIHGDPAVNAAWGEATFKDDPPKKVSNQRGFITFAQTNQAQQSIHPDLYQHQHPARGGTTSSTHKGLRLSEKSSKASMSWTRSIRNTATSKATLRSNVTFLAGVTRMPKRSSPTPT